MKKLKFVYLFLFLLCFSGCNSETEEAEDPHFLMGKRAYDKCVSCHDINRSINKVGPHLVGVLNRQSASVPDFAYSLAMRGANLVWDEATLSNYIENPRAFIPYNRMSFIGIKDPDERKALIDYLRKVAGESKLEVQKRDTYIDQFHTKYTKTQENAGSKINWLYLPGGPGCGSDYMISLIENNHLPGTHWLVDLPENGGTLEGENYDPTYDFETKWAEAFLNIFNEFDHIVLVGHSFGGMYPLLFPEIESKLSGLVIMNATPKAWQEAAVRVAKENNLPDLSEDMTAFVAEPSIEKFNKALQTCAPYYFLPEKLEEGRELLEQMSFNFYAPAWFLQKNYAAKWIPKILPTLIITSDHDFIVPHELYLNDTRFDRPNITKVDLKNAGHMSWNDAPEVTKEVFWNFYRRLHIHY